MPDENNGGDDHPLVREGIIKTLSLEASFQVVGKPPKSGIEVAGKTRPDVILRDLNLPDITGVGLAGR